MGIWDIQNMLILTKSAVFLDRTNDDNPSKKWFVKHIEWASARVPPTP
jgi:hypothetical protein